MYRSVSRWWPNRLKKKKHKKDKKHKKNKRETADKGDALTSRADVRSAGDFHVAETVLKVSCQRSPPRKQRSRSPPTAPDTTKNQSVIPPSIPLISGVTTVNAGVIIKPNAARVHYTPRQDGEEEMKRKLAEMSVFSNYVLRSTSPPPPPSLPPSTICG